MNRYDFYGIANRYLEILNPSSPEKLITVGTILGIDRNSRIIDFGCGYGELLALWAEKFGISGTGVDVSPRACDHAKTKMEKRGLTQHIEIVYQDAREYHLEEHSFNAALCIGATFIWSGYRQTIQAIKKALRSGGKLVIGECYWLKGNIPKEYLAGPAPSNALWEYELLQITHEEGFELEYVVRASHEDWDRYEAGKWHGVVTWLDENPNHAQRQQVIDHLHSVQDEYLRYQREYLGWAMYVLNPIRTDRVS
jgi:SAM-dependent methyltransferase